MIEFLSAKKIIAVKRPAKAALTAYIGIAEIGGPSTDVFVAGLDEKLESTSSAKVTLSKVFAEIGNENALKKAVAHCVPAG